MKVRNNRQAELPSTKDTIKVDIPYFQAPNILFDQPIARNKNELLILLYLTRCGNRGAIAFPSYKTIGHKCQISRETAIRAVRTLVESKVLIKHSTPYKTNTYTINLPSGVTMTPPSVTMTPYKEPSIKNLTTTRGNGHKNLFKVYEDNIGILTPLIADKLKDIAGEFPAEWFEEAVKEACDANIRKLSYIVAVLKRWQVDGFKTPKPQRHPRIVGAGPPRHSRRYEPTN